MLVDRFSVQAFAAWEAARTGQPWQLPGELAWEKAARGVDGRSFPWGDGFDPSWAGMQRSHAGAITPAMVGSFPVDSSPYGVQDMAGNMCEWCIDPFADDGPPASSARHRGQTPDAPADGATPYGVLRGGSWNSVMSSLRTTYRSRGVPSLRGNYLGFRLTRPYPGPTGA